MPVRLRIFIAGLVASIGFAGIVTPVALAGPPTTSPGPVTPKIVNGDPADIASYPWTVALLDTNIANSFDAQFCGGTLLAPQWVVTAAHCVYDSATTPPTLTPPSEIQVGFGQTNLSAIGSGSRRNVSQIIPHPSYNYATFEYDAALLFLATPISGVTPLPINTDAAAPVATATEYALGWGSTWPNPAGTTPTSAPKYPDGLRIATLADAAGPSGSCGSYGADYHPTVQLCATNTIGGEVVDTCSGDSGGPLISDVGGSNKLVGVTSFGGGCAQVDFPGVYTRVSSIAGWILTYVNAASNEGYRLVARDGGIFTFGTASYLGSTGSIRLNQPIVGMAIRPIGNGYWLVASDGGIFSFGESQFFGSTGSLKLNQPIVGMAATPTGNGYWLVASDGGIFTFGDAVFRGSTGSLKLNRPIVGMATTPTGNGYWLVASDGGIFTFGDAVFRGSTGSIALNQPIVGMATTASGNGYWLVATDGGIFTFGDAGFFGSTGSLKLNRPIVGMAVPSLGNGYWLVAADGGIFSFGLATFLGSMGGTPLNQPIVGMSGVASVI